MHQTCLGRRVCKTQLFSCIMSRGLANVGGFLVVYSKTIQTKAGYMSTKNCPHLTSKFPSKLHGAMVKQSAQLSCIN